MAARRGSRRRDREDKHEKAEGLQPDGNEAEENQAEEPAEEAIEQAGPVESAEPEPAKPEKPKESKKRLSGLRVVNPKAAGQKRTISPDDVRQVVVSFDEDGVSDELDQETYDRFLLVKQLYKPYKG